MNCLIKLITIPAIKGSHEWLVRSQQFNFIYQRQWGAIEGFRAGKGGGHGCILVKIPLRPGRKMDEEDGEARRLAQGVENKSQRERGQGYGAIN